MKKTLSVILAALLALGCVLMLASCGGNTEETTTADETTTAAAEETTGDEKTLVVGYTIYEPMNYKDEDGNLVGFDTELAQKVFENLGYTVIFQEIEWSSKYTDLNSETIDCIWNGFTANVADDDDGVLRAEKVDFSYNYMENRQVIVVKSDSTIAEAADLNGKFAVGESGSAGETYAKSFEGVTFKGFIKQTECLTEIKSGTADFAVVDAQLAKAYVGKGDYADLKVVDALSSDVEYYAIGFRKGSELTANVNAQLEALAADGTLKTLAEKYGVENTVITDFADQK